MRSRTLDYLADIVAAPIDWWCELGWSQTAKFLVFPLPLACTAALLVLTLIPLVVLSVWEGAGDDRPS